MKYILKKIHLEIITDFELALINIINEVLSMFFFNFPKSIYRKIQNVGLSCKYLNYDYCNLLACQIPALAFLLKMWYVMLKVTQKCNLAITKMNNLYHILMKIIFSVKLEFGIAKNNNRPRKRHTFVFLVS